MKIHSALSVTAIFLLIALLSFASACAPDNNVNDYFDDEADQYTVKDLRNPESDRYPLMQTEVYLPSVIVMSKKFVISAGSNLRGFFIADAEGGKYSGMVVVLRGSADLDVNPGDEFSIRGIVTEFCGIDPIYDFCSPQLELTEGILRSENNEMPAPERIDDPAQLVAGASLSKTYQHTLVTVGPVTVEAAANRYGQFTITGGLFVDDMLYAASPAVGTAYRELSGFLYTAYGVNQIEPRDAADLSN